jgi:acetate kinase
VTDTVLALNAGSSTIKYALYGLDEGREQQLAAETLKTQGAACSEILAAILGKIAVFGAGPPSCIGHRVVHGGSIFAAPILVDASMPERLQQLVPLAPLHLPPALSLMQHALSLCPAAVQVACFDTAFHRTLPDVARRFALPNALYETEIRRYGFHGLSYEYILSVFGAAPPERLIVAHLGSGASLCAIKSGCSIDTSMGLTPTAGIPMGTRSGDLDPGILLYLMRERGYGPDELEQLLNHGSGLLGVGGSSNMVELLSRISAGESRALAAVELFAYSIKKQIGAYVAALGGVDCLVFTGGIGEHAPLVRELACRNLEVLGIDLNPALNAENAPVISRSTSGCQVRVIPTNEDLVIARAAYQLARTLRA